jgi:hypothetical protein
VAALADELAWLISALHGAGSKRKLPWLGGGRYIGERPGQVNEARLGEHRGAVP